MAGVPEIQPSAQPEGAPTPVEPHPPVLDAPGRALSEFGQAVAGVGVGAYMRAATDFAEDKNAEFQKLALQIRNKFRGLHMLDASKNHQSATDAIDQARQIIEQTIKSDHARSLYKTNSQRTQRIVQESVDQHDESESDKYHRFTYEQGQSEDARLLSNLATDPQYNAKGVGEVLQRMHDRALTQVEGADAESAKKYADAAVARGTDALFQVLTHKDNPNRVVAAAELEKYAKMNWVDRAGYKDVLNTLAAGDAINWARGEFQKFDKFDNRKNPDPQGAVPHAAVESAVEETQKSDLPDTVKGARIDALEAEYKRHRADYEQAGFEMREGIASQAALNDGKVQVDTLDFQKFARLHGTLADQMVKASEDRAWALGRRAHLSAFEISKVAGGELRERLDMMTRDELQKYSKERLRADLDTEYINNKGKGAFADPGVKARMEEYLDKLKTGKADPVEREFKKITDDTVGEHYKGRQDLIRAARNRAYWFLSDEHRANPNATSDDLRGKLEEAVKSGRLLGKTVFGIEVQPPYQRKAPSSAPEGWYPDGKGGRRYWTGESWR